MLELTFISGGTVEGPDPETTEDVSLVNFLGEEEASAEVAFPPRSALQDHDDGCQERRRRRS